MDATAGSAFSRSLKECAERDLWNQSRMSCCLTAGGADFGACYADQKLVMRKVLYFTYHCSNGRVLEFVGKCSEDRDIVWGSLGAEYLLESEGSGRMETFNYLDFLGK